MWFLIKGSFWTTMTLVALSFLSPGAENGGDDSRSRIEVTGALNAAGEAYRYVSALCSEKPDVCEKGAETFTALQHRARDGARVAYQLLDRHLADESPETAEAPYGGNGDGADRLTTGTVVPLPHFKPAR